MRFQAPEGALKWWSILWIIFGVIAFALYSKDPVRSAVLLYYAGPIAIGSVGLWFRLKICAYALIAIYVVALVIGVVLISKGVVDVAKIVRLLLTCYFIWLLIDYIREINAEDRLAKYRAENGQE